MSLPQRNASLLELRAPGTAEEYDGPSAGGSLWSGDADAYLTTKRRMTGAGDGSGGGGQVVDERVLIIAAGDVAADITVGTIAIYQPTGSALPKSAPIARVDGSDIDDADIPAELITVRLVLDLR